MKKTITATMGAQTSPAYMAPEVIKNATPTSKVDIWALGIILYQMLSYNQHPFKADNVFAMAMAIKDNEPELSILPSTVTPFIMNTIKELLNKNPDERPSAQ